jgi:hypothetical protein
MVRRRYVSSRAGKVLFARWHGSRAVSGHVGPGLASCPGHVGPGLASCPGHVGPGSRVVSGARWPGPRVVSGAGRDGLARCPAESACARTAALATARMRDRRLASYTPYPRQTQEMRLAVKHGMHHAEGGRALAWVSMSRSSARKLSK